MKFQALALSLVITTLSASSSFAQPVVESMRPDCPPGMEAECLNEYSALNIIHHTNKLEIFQSEAALHISQDTRVRDYARMLITEHRENNRQLRTLAEQENVLLSFFHAATFERAA
ncbi:MAG: DUF4142 domain-containing protein [Bdellovibrionia bacterium]